VVNSFHSLVGEYDPMEDNLREEEYIDKEMMPPLTTPGSPKIEKRKQD
jgi:hypothetical protein